LPIRMMILTDGWPVRRTPIFSRYSIAARGD
jgi:hypothetical protein